MQLPDTGLQSAENAVLDEQGVQKRKGIDHLNGAAWTGDEVRQLMEWRRGVSGTSTILGVTRTTAGPTNKLYSIADNGTRTLIHSGINREYVGHVPMVAGGADKFYYTDGAEYYVYNGTAYEKARPAITHGSVTSGPFQVNDVLTGGTSGATATVDVVGAGYLGVSGVSVTGFSSGETITGSVSGASAAITGIDAGVVSTNDLAPVKRCKWMVYHPKSYRVFAAGDSTDQGSLYYSESNDGVFFKSTSVMRPISSEGPIKAIAVFGDSVVVFYKEAVYAWTGSDPATATWFRLPIPDGCIAWRSVCLTPNTLTYLGEGGLYVISPSVLDLGNTVVEPGSQMVRNVTENKVMKAFDTSTSLADAWAVFDSKNQRLLVGYDNAGSSPDRVLVLHWAFQAFTRWTIGANASEINYCGLRRDNGDVILGRNAYASKINTGYSDEGTAISFEMKTKRFHLDAPLIEKLNDFTFVAAKEFDDADSQIDVTVTADYRSMSFTSIQVDESLAWGSTWGFTWGDIEAPVKRLRGRLKGRRFEVKITNARDSEPVEIHGVAFEHKVLKPKGTIVNA